MIITLKVNQKINPNVNISFHMKDNHKTKNFSFQCKKWNNYKTQNLFNQIKQKDYRKTELKVYEQNSLFIKTELKAHEQNFSQKRVFSNLNTNKNINAQQINHFKLFNLIHKQKDNFMKRNFSNLEKNKHIVCGKCENCEKCKKTDVKLITGINSEKKDLEYYLSKTFMCKYLKICICRNSSESLIFLSKLLHILLFLFSVWVFRELKIYDRCNILLIIMFLLSIYLAFLAMISPCLGTSFFLILSSVAISKFSLGYI